MIEFEALSLSSKELPVTPVVVGLPAPGYRLDSLTLDPDVVTVRGPLEVLDQMDHLKTTPLVMDGLTRDAVFAVSVTPERSVSIVGAKEIQATVKISEIQPAPPAAEDQEAKP